MSRIPVWIAVAFAVLGCASDYSWRSRVPERMRSVAVPVFRNESDITGLGSAAARQLLREFQREGTFRIADKDDCALGIQGVVRKSAVSTAGYDRGTGMRLSNCDLSADVEISVVDKTSGRLLVENRRYTAKTTFIENGDHLTAKRDASGRLAEDLARQVVDDVLSLKW